MSTGGIAVCVVGLGFGADFLPIYQAHPEVGEVGVVEPDEARRAAAADRHGIAHAYAGLEEALDSGRWDAVHVLTPVRFHVDHAIAVMSAGAHCAVAVPMATDLEAIDRVLAAQAASGRHYMMMETAAYTRELLTARDLLEAGELGDLSLYRGRHIQNLDGYAPYWQGYPPMHYATHALSPVLALTGSTVTEVRAMGSGHLLEPHRAGGYDNPFPTELGLFSLAGSDVVAEVTMSFFRTARRYVEGFDLYGDRLSLEWPEEEELPWRAHEMRPAAPGQRGREVVERAIATDDHRDLLPAPLQRFTREFEIHHARTGEVTTRPAEHGGSHPHLVHEFITSVAADRPPAIDAVTAARWTAPGIVAHASALAGGTPMEVPRHG